MSTYADSPTRNADVTNASAAASGEPRARRVLRYAYACRTLGVLTFLLWLVPVAASQTAVTHVDRGGAPAPNSGSFYLSNYSSTTLTCYVTPDSGESRTLTLKPIRSIWRFDGLLGVKVDRWFNGPAEVACDPSPPQARMKGGPLVPLFPLAEGIELPIAAFVLVAVGWGDYFLPWRRRPAPH